MAFRTLSSTARMKGFLGLLLVAAHWSVVFAGFFWDDRRHNFFFSSPSLRFVLHVTMVVERKPMEKKVEGAMAMDGERHKVGRRRASSKTDTQRKDSWLTPALAKT